MARQGPSARPVRGAGPIRKPAQRPGGGPRQVRKEHPQAAPRRKPRKILGGNAKPRLVVGRLVLIFVLAIAGLRLVYVQGIDAPSLSAEAEQERATPIFTPAQRGTITDRNGNKLAFSVQSDALYYQPQATEAKWNVKTDKITYAAYVQEVASYLPQVLGGAVDQQSLVSQLSNTKSKFIYLDKQVEPAIAEAIHQKFPFVGIEPRSLREYPNGTVASNVVGLATWQSLPRPGNKDYAATKGLIGLESSMNSQLSGTPGQEIADTEAGNDKVIIPGTERDVQQGVNGDDVQLTIDTDLQYEVQQLVAQYVAEKGARDGSAVVMDVKTGQVYALADDQSFDPNNPSTITNANSGDEAVTTPFEPGSVNKIVTMAAAMNAGTVTPDTVVDVPSVLHYPDGVTIHDAENHGDIKMTVTGVFAQSSNIGTDEIAHMVGANAFDAMLLKMGVGQKTNVGLPGESAGSVPAMKDWSASTFDNLPFGQGLSVTVLQMADEYQAIANGGVRIPPRIIQSITEPDGTVVPTQQPAGVRVVSPQTAKTLLDMMRAVLQNSPHGQSGTGVSAALPGYQIAGKTGTAQQIVNGTYSKSDNTTTFVGILSADNPRFVVAVMLDRPTNGADESAETAAPLFHDIASYIVSRYNLPVSTQPVPFSTLVVSP
ncbi:MAG TPA: penicillin-binding protein 2 [Pseudonocardiaceae bacterium]|jgi:cell division protein FtsI (penicillin-binding protein 3)|nr:penicillin-binding protein 2 [Pseudonocardiaceae bacterium]